MKIIIDTENKKKNKEEKERDDALWKQEQEERLAIACDSVFLIPTTILLFLIFWFGSPVGDVCRQALASGS